MKLKIFAVLALGLLLLGCVSSPPAAQGNANPQAPNGPDVGNQGNEAAQPAAPASGAGVCNYLTPQEVKTALGFPATSVDLTTNEVSSTECSYLYDLSGTLLPTLSVKVESADYTAETVNVLKQYLTQAGATIDAENEFSQASVRYNIANSQCDLVTYKGGKTVSFIFMDLSNPDGKCDSAKLKPLAQALLGKLG